MRQNNKPSPKTQEAVSGLLAQYAEKYPDMGAVHETQIREFLFNLPIPQLRAYGARFHALMEALEIIREEPSTEAQRGLIKLIGALERESGNRRYRRIMKALAVAAQSENGLSRAYWTALRTLEMTFEWTNEYMFAFSVYTQWLKRDRLPLRTVPSLNRTGR